MIDEQDVVISRRIAMSCGMRCFLFIFYCTRITRTACVIWIDLQFCWIIFYYFF